MITAVGPLTLEEAEAVLSSVPPPPDAEPDTPAPQSQSAPTPDYSSDLPPEVEACSCEEALALRAEVAQLRADRDEWKGHATKAYGDLGAADGCLATATALVREAARAVEDMLDRYQAKGLTSIKSQAVLTRLRDFLANQPAAPRIVAPWGITPERARIMRDAEDGLITREEERRLVRESFAGQPATPDPSRRDECGCGHAGCPRCDQPAAPTRPPVTDDMAYMAREHESDCMHGLAPATRADDTKKREPGCECHLEEGDSPCVVHGLYEADEGCECPGAHECGVTTSTATNERKARAEAEQRWFNIAGADISLGSVAAALGLAKLHVCTEADQAVLDAMGRAGQSTLLSYANSTKGDWLGDACRAELARRGLKP